MSSARGFQTFAEVNVRNGWWSQEVDATLYHWSGEVMRWRRDDDGCSVRRRAQRFGIAGSVVKG